MANHEQIVRRVRDKAGGPAALAAALGIKTQAISQWRKIPVSRAHAVAGFTGIPLHELRPDIFPGPETIKEAS